MSTSAETGVPEDEPRERSAPEDEPGGEQGNADERRAKLERLRESGVEPFPHISTRVPRTWIADVQAAHDPSQLAAGEHESLNYRIAGRLIARRGHAKTTFFDVRDQSGSLQVVARQEAMGQEAYDAMLDLDIG